MHARPPSRLSATLGVLVLLTWLGGAAASPLPVRSPAGEFPITLVKVYPGSATVERTARLAAGSRSVTFDCLPSGLDPQSLQVSADASVRLGETSVLTTSRALSANCAGSRLDARIRELEGQKDALLAESEALGLVSGYLKGLSSSSGAAAAARQVPLDAKGLTGVADALRRTGQDALLRQRQITRLQADIDQQLAPVLAERQRERGMGSEVTAVTVTLSAPAEAQLKLSYQVNGPGWTPTYRALLDTATRKVRIERQALVAQSTGEDWRGVKLLLSTGQPGRETAGRLPAPWRIGVEAPPPPMREKLAMRSLAMSAPPAPAPAEAEARRQNSEPVFDTSVFNNSFATEFSVPQSIDVPSGGQRVTVALGGHEDTAVLIARTSPRTDAGAFLVADMAVPAGVWPDGPMQLYRDGAFVGSGHWSASAEARLTLSFGRDELVRVQAEPELANDGSGGFIGGRAERRVQRVYAVENRHATPVTVQVIEAAPVSIDDQVRVTAQFTPQPAETAWRQQPGLAMWTFDLAPGKSARVAAEYVISHPKDVHLQSR